MHHVDSDKANDYCFAAILEDKQSSELLNVSCGSSNNGLISFMVLLIICVLDINSIEIYFESYKAFK